MSNIANDPTAIMNWDKKFILLLKNVVKYGYPFVADCGMKFLKDHQRHIIPDMISLQSTPASRELPYLLYIQISGFAKATPRLIPVLELSLRSEKLKCRLRASQLDSCTLLRLISCIFNLFWSSCIFCSQSGEASFVSCRIMLSSARGF